MNNHRTPADVRMTRDEMIPSDDFAHRKQNALVTDIKSRIKVEVVPKYPTGTLIRFNRKDQHGMKRKYAALFAAKRWWTTSAVRGLAIMSDEQFFELMGQPSVSKVEVATAFERIK